MEVINAMYHHAIVSIFLIEIAYSFMMLLLSDCGQIHLPSCVMYFHNIVADLNGKKTT